MKNINWIGRKARGKSCIDCDVLISVTSNGTDKSGRRRFHLCIRFTEDAAKKVSQPHGFIRYGRYAEDGVNRCYFMSCRPDEGLKLCRGTNMYTAQSQSDDASERYFWVQHSGGYNLLYDREESCHYVDLDCPIFKTKKGGEAS